MGRGGRPRQAPAPGGQSTSCSGHTLPARSSGNFLYSAYDTLAIADQKSFSADQQMSVCKQELRLKIRDAARAVQTGFRRHGRPEGGLGFERPKGTFLRSQANYTR